MFAPMPSASDRTVTSVTNGVRMSVRSASRGFTIESFSDVESVDETPDVGSTFGGIARFPIHVWDDATDTRECASWLERPYPVREIAS